MCGLFASITKHNINSDKVLSSLMNRGPDGQGILTRELKSNSFYLNLLHARLSIIDPVEKSNQPLYSSDQRYAIIFNGEIYNYRELRKELIDLGVNFETHSDTEVLLQSYIVWKEDFLPRLRGIFSFVIWDEHTQEIFIARDHFGIKPLYYFYQDNEFACASRISTLLSSNLIDRKKIDRDSLAYFINYGSINAQSSLLAQVSIFPPGHYAYLKNGRLEISQYWKMQIPKEKSNCSYEETLKEVKSNILEAIELQMRADVDIGVFLSGGIDSGLITGLVAKLTDRKVQSFSLGFEGRGDLLEWELARQSAKRFNTKHHEVKIGATIFNDSFEDFIDALDHPSVDGLNSYFISKYRDPSLKVCLSGLGADEVFAGYYFHPKIYKAKGAPAAISNLCSLIPYSIAKKLKHPYFTHNIKNLPYILESQRKISPFLADSETKNHSEILNKDLLLSYSTIYELEHYTGHTLLRDADATSMHHSLEVRVPFLDPNVVSSSLNISDEFKISPHYNKPLLIDAFPGLLSENIYRQKKRGFEMPVGPWIKERFGNELALLPGQLEKVGIAPSLVEGSLAIFNKNINHYIPIWRFIVLYHWMKQYKIGPYGS